MARWLQGVPLVRIAEELGVGVTTVWNVLQWHTWAHLFGEEGQAMESAGFRAWVPSGFAAALQEVEKFAVRAVDGLQDRDYDHHPAASAAVRLLDVIRAALPIASELDQELRAARRDYGGDP
jgi:hypothetical protein